MQGNDEVVVGGQFPQALHQPVDLGLGVDGAIGELLGGLADGGGLVLVERDDTQPVAVGQGVVLVPV